MSKNIVGIRSIGLYFPPEIRDSKYISEASGIPEEVIREKFGITQVHKARKEDSVSAMAVKAARNALADLSPEEIDLVVYCGSEFKDYYLYNIASKIAHELGTTRAQCFELHSLCSAGVYSLKVLKSMMLGDDALDKALLISSSREGDLINYKDQENRFMFNFGDGAAAVLLEKGFEDNEILETAMIVDGSFAQDVCVPAVGSENFEKLKESPYEDFFLRVMDAQNMKERLDPITLKNFIEVIYQAVEKSGYTVGAIDFVAPLFMKKSISDYLLEELGLSEESTYHLDCYGHVQSADVFISVKKGVETGKIKPGDLVVLVAAGTGYSWAATVVKWGTTGV